MIMATAAGTALRVVIENDDLRIADAQAAALRGAGFRVAVCAGPAALPDGRCPAVDGHGCVLVAGADLVVHNLDIGDPEDRAVFEAVRRRWPDIPIILEAPVHMAVRHGDLLDNCRILPRFDVRRLVTTASALARGFAR
jgi:hypothetical protein